MLSLIATVPKVDLPKFMGEWYVISAIPTTIENESYHALENYKLNDEGTIATTFSSNLDSFDRKLKTYELRGFVVKHLGNAI